MMIRALLYSFIAVLLAGCSLPPPDDVVRACLDELSDNNYTKMLAYTGPNVINAYSNNLWLSKVHQMYVKDQEISVDPADLITATSAQVRTHLTFHQKRSAGGRTFFLRLDLGLRDKWYIDDIWHLNPDGTIKKNALKTIPSSPFMY
jgi:hypothetical protein